MPYEVIAALERGERTAALRRAIALWRDNRAPYVADAIAAISDSVSYDPSEGSSFQTVWLDLAAENDARARDGGDPAAIGWLLETLEEGLELEPRRRGGRVVTDLGDRVSALARVSPDPRVATRLIALLARSTESPGDEMPWATFRPILETIVVHADIGHVERLRRIADSPRGLDARVRKALETLVPQYIQRLARRVPVPADEEEAWRSLIPSTAAGGRAGHPERLLAAIYADPNDDESRLVYADLLQTAGDPRGELIALQMIAPAELTETMAARLSALLFEHSSEWIGPGLGEILSDVVFERGFLAEATIDHRSRPADAEFWLAVRDPRLSTLHTLRTGRGAEAVVAKFLQSPALRHLRSLEVGAMAELCALRSIARPIGVRRLALRFAPAAPELHEIGALRALDDVEALSFVAGDGVPDEALDALASADLPPKLTRWQIEVVVDGDEAVDRLTTAVGALPGTLRGRITITAA